MLGVEIKLIFRRVLGPLGLGWAPNHFVLGGQLDHGEKRLVCIPDQQAPVSSLSNHDINFSWRYSTIERCFDGWLTVCEKMDSCVLLDLFF